MFFDDGGPPTFNAPIDGHRHPLRAQGSRETLRRTHYPSICRARSNTNQEPLRGKPGPDRSTLKSRKLHVTLHAARCLAQRQFAQRNKVTLLEEVLKSPLRLSRNVHLPGGEP